MITQTEFESALAVFQAREDIRSKLIDLCEPIGQALGFTEVVDIELHSGGIHFLAKWYGSYQSQQSEWFTITSDMFNLTQDEIIYHFRIKAEEERVQKIKEEKDKRDREERATYERLKEKFS